MFIFMLVLASGGNFQVIDAILVDHIHSPEGEEDGHINAVAKCSPAHHQGRVSHIQIAFGANKCYFARFFSHFYILFQFFSPGNRPGLNES